MSVRIRCCTIGGMEVEEVRGKRSEVIFQRKERKKQTMMSDLDCNIN